MSGKRKVCALYSAGAHYPLVLRRLREAYPDAEITALVPPEYPVPEEGLPGADRVERLAGRGLRDAAAALRQVRGGAFDVFAVMFDSPRLRMLAALSGARERAWCTPGGRLVPLTGSAPRVALGEAARLMRGHVVFGALWALVRVLPVGRRQ